MKSTFEKMGGTYTLGADGIYYPNLVSTDEEPHYGKYGMMRQMMEKQGITEEMKACDQMEWVRAVNGIRNMAEEQRMFELKQRKKREKHKGH